VLCYTLLSHSHSYLSDRQVALAQHRPEPRVKDPLQQRHDGVRPGGFPVRRRQAVGGQLRPVDEAVDRLLANSSIDVRLWYAADSQAPYPQDPGPVPSAARRRQKDEWLGCDDRHAMQCNA